MGVKYESQILLELIGGWKHRTESYNNVWELINKQIDNASEMIKFSLWENLINFSQEKRG